MGKLKIDPKNFRIHSDKNKDVIRKSLEQCGAGRSVLADRDDFLIAGNGVYEQAQEIGIPIRVIETNGEELIVVKRNDLSFGDEKRKLLAFADNHASDTSDFDFDLVVDSFSKEVLNDFHVDVDDFTPTRAKDDLFVEEEIDTIIETDIKVGDKFEIIYNGQTSRLHCGDSCSDNDVKLLMGDEKADIIFTDPPYDLEDKYSTNIFNAAGDSCHIFIMNSDKLLIDNVNNGIKWFRKFFAVDFRLARLVSNNQPMTRVDLIAEFCKGKTKFNNLYDGFSTLIECAKIHNNNESINFGHKQAKRVELPGTFISHYSNTGELVVDLFAGSGSTFVASLQLGRRCYAQEYDPKNCQIIINRLKKTFENIEINHV